MSDLDGTPELDVCIDGADEVLLQLLLSVSTKAASVNMATTIVTIAGRFSLYLHKRWRWLSGEGEDCAARCPQILCEIFSNSLAKQLT